MARGKVVNKTGTPKDARRERIQVNPSKKNKIRNLVIEDRGRHSVN